MFELAVFWIFAAILVLAAGCVITVRNPVHSALFLVLAFFTAAALWMLLEAEFLAIALVLVYVGAVMVLFLFVVMMLDINLDRLREGYWDYLVPAVILLVAIVAAIALTLRHRKDTKYLDPPKQINVLRKDRVRMVSMPSEKQD